jgi:hypothetical protein
MTTERHKISRLPPQRQGKAMVNRPMADGDEALLHCGTP